ncbi:MAG: DUF1292 domain-containing protein [Bacilli bacterium]|nr:DUF1292 domain-containing protein [Bacilli bacterium]
MNSKVFKMKLSDGTEKRCVILSEFGNEENGKEFVFYAYEDQIGTDSAEIFSAIRKEVNGSVMFEQIVDAKDLEFVNEMFNSLNGLSKEGE